MARCILCDERKKPSKEDAVPRWVNKMLVRSHPGPFTSVIDGARVGKITAHPRRFITRRPCVDCNWWMNEQFEKPAQPILEPMMERATERVLSADEQRIVANWVMKTTLMIRLFAHWKQQFPVSEYHRLRIEGTVGPSVLVWIGGRADAKGPNDPGPLAASPPKTIPRTYVPDCIGSTWSLGHFVAQLLYKTGGQYGALQNTGELYGALNRIWPVTVGGITWPPTFVLNDAGVAMLGQNLVS